MSENPYQSPESDLAPPDRSLEKQLALSQPDELPPNSRFSIRTLLLIMSCAAVNAAAFAQPLTAFPILALACNAFLFLALVRDLQRYSDDLRLKVHCLLVLIIMAASMPLILIVLANWR